MQTWFDTDDFATLEKTFLERNRRAPDDYDVVHGLQEVYYKWGKWPQALEWSTRAAKLRPHDAEAQYGVGTFIWQILAAHGGGPDMAAYDPRPRPAPEDSPPVPRKAKRKGSPDEPEMVAPPPPPAAAPDDITGQARVDLADKAIAHLEKAVALRPHYGDALTYLGLVWRQKSFGLFADPAAWQQAVDRANEWQTRALRGAGREELRWRSRHSGRKQRRRRARAASGSGTRCRLRSTARCSPSASRIRSGTSRSCRRRCSR